LLSAAGMVVLAAAENLITTFVGLELLSLPLYVLCASRMRSERSLEAGLKYLIIGSVGSATLLYGFALIYGATGATDYAGIASAASKSGMTGDVLLLTGVGLSVVGLAFKSSLAPFHQWTPDVYEGSPTPVAAYMSVATKVAAFAATIRLFDIALGGTFGDWKPLWEVIAVASILVGNVGALGQASLKRMLAYSSIAQAGYLLVAFVVGTEVGVEALMYYLVVYLFANLAAFAVVIARERETDRADDMAALRGLASVNPLLAVVMTLAMLSLAGIPATAGFIGKFNLISAAVDGDLSWLGIVIVVGSMISLAYYIPVVAAMWGGGEPVPARREDPRTGLPALAGAAPEADELSIEEPVDAPARVGIEVTIAAALLGLATLVFGIVPQPLFDLVDGAARGLGLS
jgi:NADH-quinone oxidoreductase subunit N